MDEPTNHLDIDTVEALAQALRSLIIAGDRGPVGCHNVVMLLMISLLLLLMMMMSAFREFKGGVVLVSHDQNLLQRVCHQVTIIIFRHASVSSTGPCLSVGP